MERLSLLVVLVVCLSIVEFFFLAVVLRRVVVVVVVRGLSMVDVFLLGIGEVFMVKDDIYWIFCNMITGLDSCIPFDSLIELSNLWEKPQMLTLTSEIKGC